MVKKAKRKTKSASGSQSSQVEKMKLKFLYQLGRTISLVALLFALSLFVGYFFSKTLIVDNESSQSFYMKTQVSNPQLTPGPNQSTNIAPSTNNMMSPAAKGAENFVLAGAFLLGLIGSVTFVTLKLTT